jgi:hypothetical protein
VVLPIGPGERQVQVIRRSGKADTLTLSAATEQWLRHGYEQRMGTEAVRRDLGEILSHGEPVHGMGQGEAAEQEPERFDAQAFWDGELAPDQAERAQGEPAKTEEAPGDQRRDDGLVVVDFRGLGPDAA